MSNSNDMIWTIDESKLSYRVIVILDPNPIAALDYRMGPILKPFAVNIFTLKEILSEGHDVHAVNPFRGDQTPLTLQNYNKIYFSWEDVVPDVNGLPETDDNSNGKYLKVVNTAGAVDWSDIDWEDIKNIPPEIVGMVYENATHTKDGLMSSVDKIYIDGLPLVITNINSEVENKISKVGTPTNRNLAMFDAEGNVIDTNVSVDKLGVLNKLTESPDGMSYDGELLAYKKDIPEEPGETGTSGIIASETQPEDPDKTPIWLHIQ